ncbi:hypothetical protein [Caldimonas sp. KR1-144]|uniref:hypothetical protein n=1 Tax=Caldimonas sp. KR1-144 TaxID=3400911 RepID=UPI003C03A081
MRRVDVCNGDADGLCALRQWRLQHPAADARLVTGLKREIALLDRVPAGSADELVVCDISIDRNRAALTALLDAGAQVRWFDHHEPGAPIVHARLAACIDTAPAVCTSALVDRAVGGRHRAWAAVGAFGDNLLDLGRRLCATAGVEGEAVEALRRLGEAINYNAYGDDERDVRLPPRELYALMARYAQPWQLLHGEPVIGEIEGQRQDDLARAQALAPAWQGEGFAAWLLPDAPWSRRVVGCFANELVRGRPATACAVLLPHRDGGWRVSLRAPAGAAQIAAGFGGSGRARAAGIDRLPPECLGALIAALPTAMRRRAV